MPVDTLLIPLVSLLSMSSNTAPRKTPQEAGPVFPLEVFGRVINFAAETGYGPTLSSLTRCTRTFEQIAQPLIKERVGRTHTEAHGLFQSFGNGRSATASQDMKTLHIGHIGRANAGISRLADLRRASPGTGIYRTYKLCR